VPFENKNIISYVQWNNALGSVLRSWCCTCKFRSRRIGSGHVCTKGHGRRWMMF
jgi:hypothetical protein